MQIKLAPGACGFLSSGLSRPLQPIANLVGNMLVYRAEFPAGLML